MRKNIIGIIVVLSCFLWLPEMNAQVEKKISVQGFLKDENGKAVQDGSYNITFRIFNASIAGDILWASDRQLTVAGGVYSAQLYRGIDPSSGDSLTIDSLAWTIPYYLSVEINNSGQLLEPRTALTYSPYAFAVNFANEAALANDVKCSGAVGDIKYSILAPAQFIEVNGDCWVPMDGQTTLNRTKLKSYLDNMSTWNSGSSMVPDLSGLFIRAHEFSSSNQNYDPARSPSDAIATLQLDDYKAHNHTMNPTGTHSHTINVRGLSGNTLRGLGSGVSGAAIETFGGTTSTDGSHTHTINQYGGSESRPMNLSFYSYARIN